MSNDEYYRLRLDEELKAAAGAADPSIAQIHRDLAERYRELLNGDRAVAQAGGRIAERGPVAA